MRKPVFGVSDQVRLKLACSATETSYRLEILDIETRDIILSRQRTTKVLIRLLGCTGWSASLLFVYGINRCSHEVAHIIILLFCFSGQIPVVQLNYAAMSFESPYDRDVVENCVREILGAVHRAVGAKKNVELTFNGIGRLQIRDSRVKMKFYKEFINTMDGSGKLLDSLQNVSFSQIIRIFNGCEVQIGNSVTRVTVWHHEGRQVMPHVYQSDWIFSSHWTTIIDSFSCILFLWQFYLSLNMRYFVLK